MKKKNEFKRKMIREIEDRFDNWNATHGWPFPRGRDRYMTLQAIMIKCAMAGYSWGRKAERAGAKDDE